ncbi:MAG: GAP family protein [Solirubrobacteraceae bacterium]
MSSLAEALPLALSAAVYPPALLVLLRLLNGQQPRRLVLAYYGGAATLTTSAGLTALAVLHGAHLTTHSSTTASGSLYILIGLLLLGLAARAWRRRARDPGEAPQDTDTARGRIADWSNRATASPKWAFVLGLAMFLPSPLYLLAVQDIANSGDATASNVLAVLTCAIAVMVFVEVPLVAMFIQPEGVAAKVNSFHTWLTHNGWSLAAILALAAGIYAILTGANALT